MSSPEGSCLVGLTSRPRATLHVGVDAVLCLKFVVVVSVSPVLAAVSQDLDDGIFKPGSELRRSRGESDKAGEENLEERKKMLGFRRGRRKDRVWDGGLGGRRDSNRRSYWGK